MKKSGKVLLVSCSILLALLAIPMALLLQFRSLLKENAISKDEVFSLVNKNKQLILADISEILEKEGRIHDGISDASFNRCNCITTILSIRAYDDRIKFECGGTGMGGQTTYSGFYYFSSEESLEAFLYKGHYVSTDNGYISRQAGGDNEMYIERIVDNFYYYNEKY